MFTGLIERRAIIAERKFRGNAGKLTLRLEEPLENPVPGESVSVNGACLTLESSKGNLLVFHVLEETFKRTNLGSLPIESIVNVERAMKSGERFGGHFVSGHVDATVKVLTWGEVGEDIALTISIPTELQTQVIPKGSVSIDGISLTIASLSDGALTVHLIPTTLDETALRERNEGDLVNLETDMIGKYVVANLSSTLGDSSSVSMDSLSHAGW